MVSQQKVHPLRVSYMGGAAGKDRSEGLFMSRERRKFCAPLVGASASSEEAPEAEDPNASLEDAARGEQEYLRRRLREELKREPTEEEMNEWLRQHTEGY